MSYEPKHIILPIMIDGRRFRIHIGGDERHLAAVIPQIRELMSTSTREDDFLARLNELLAANDVVLADIFDLNAADSSRVDTFTVLKAIAKSRTADIAWSRLKILFETSDEDGLNELVMPTDRLMYTRMYIESVLRDLDEHTDSATSELRALLPEVYAYLLLD